MEAKFCGGTLLQTAKQHALQKLGLRKLKPEQSKAIDACINNFDAVISLPTGFGKSVVFQSIPICQDFIREHTGPRDDDKKSLAIIILPIKALALDQVRRAHSRGIEAASMMDGVSDQIMEDACQGKYSLLFTSPEVLLSSRGKELLQARTVYSQLCGLFIDESHCVVKWGQSSGTTAVFREFYGLLAELRSVMQLRTPIVAMTATATHYVRESTIRSLGMQNVILINSNPVVRNIKHVVTKTKMQDSAKIFQWLIDDLAQYKAKTDRVIIFCQSRKDCSELYSVFKSLLTQPLHRHFNIYHTNTENDIQQEISKDFSVADGYIRVLFATIAFGLGVDVKGVNNIIMYGAPQEIDDYIQLCGRGGRDGSQSLSVLVKTTKKTGRPLSKEIKEFISTTECRCRILIAAFPGDNSRENITMHNCCDNCSRKCSCGGKDTPCRPSHIEEQLSNITQEFKQFRTITVTAEESAKIKEDILNVREQQLLSLPSKHLYSGTDVTNVIPTASIDLILANVHYAMTYSQFCMQYTFPNQDITKQIWAILAKHLGEKLVSLSSAAAVTDGSSSSDDDAEETLLAAAEYQEPIECSSESD